jgi:uncharacterized protein YuzE
MKIYYDEEVDAAYIEISTEHPHGVVEAEDGINLDMTDDNRLVGIEILDASKKFPIESLFRFEVEQPLKHAA